MAKRPKFQFQLTDLLWAVGLSAVACTLGMGAWKIIEPLGQPPQRAAAPSVTINYSSGGVSATASSFSIPMRRELSPGSWFLIVAAIAFAGGAVGRLFRDPWKGILFGSIAGSAVAWALSTALRHGASW